LAAKGVEDCPKVKAWTMKRSANTPKIGTIAFFIHLKFNGTIDKKYALHAIFSGENNAIKE